MTRYMDSLKKRLRESYKCHRNNGGWRAVGREFGITAAMAYRIVKDNYEPADLHIRHTLGLPLIVPMPACPVCGIVHVSRQCPLNRKLNRKWRDWLDYSSKELELLFKERITL